MYTILLVDDEPMMIKGMRFILEGSDLPIANIVEAANGLEAIQSIQQFGADVVITDIRMPDSNGLQLSRYLMLEYPITPCIIVSGFDEFTYAQQAIQYGVKDFLLKPLNESIFLTTLRTTLDKLKEHVYPISMTVDEWRALAVSWTNVILEGKEELRTEVEHKWISCLRKAPPSIFIAWHSIYHESLLQKAGDQLEKSLDCPLIPYAGGSMNELENWVLNDFAEVANSIHLNAQSDIQKTIYSAKLWIQEHYNKEISLDELASSLGYTSPYFSLLFKERTGMSYLHYRSQIRMNRAKELLVKTDKPITEIASDVGYNDVAGFNRAFKKAAGVTPSDYRKG